MKSTRRPTEDEVEELHPDPALVRNGNGSAV